MLIIEQEFSDSVRYGYEHNGELVYHREDGPAVIYSPDEYTTINEEEWYHHGKLHREDGPAATYCFEEYDVNDDETYITHALYWYYNGARHRYCGPAIENPEENAYYIHGNHIDEIEYKEWIAEMGMNLLQLSEDDKLVISLKWS